MLLKSNLDRQTLGICGEDSTRRLKIEKQKKWSLFTQARLSKLPKNSKSSTVLGEWAWHDTRGCAFQNNFEGNKAIFSAPEPSSLQFHCNRCPAVTLGPSTSNWKEIHRLTIDGSQRGNRTNHPNQQGRPLQADLVPGIAPYCPSCPGGHLPDCPVASFSMTGRAAKYEHFCMQTSMQMTHSVSLTGDFSL